jgi:hypothetical protein
VGSRPRRLQPPVFDRAHGTRSGTGECGAVVTHSPPPDRGWHQCVVGRVRALIGWRIRKQTRHAGVHEVCDAASCERRHAARPVEPPAGRTAVTGGKRFPARLGCPAPATAQQRVEVSHREDCLRPDAGDRRRGQVVGSSRLARPAAGAHGPPTCPPRSGGLPPPPGSSELPNHVGTDSGRGDSARTAATVLVVHVHDDVAT